MVEELCTEATCKEQELWICCSIHHRKAHSCDKASVYAFLFIVKIFDRIILVYDTL